MYWDPKGHSAWGELVPQPHMPNYDFPGSLAGQVEIEEEHQGVGYYVPRILKMVSTGCGVDG